MKILFFIDSLNAGGKERRLTELMKALVLKQDIEFELVVMSNIIHYKEVLKLGIKIHYLTRTTKKDISVFARVYKLCRNYRPDIVHCWDSMTAVYLVSACKLLSIKLVNGMVVDSPAKQNMGNKHWFRAKLTFPFSDIIVGNSKAGLLAYRAPKNKSVVIHNGFNFDRTENLIDKETIKKQISTDSKILIGMVASFSQHKDFKTYYRAASLILNRRKDITFLAIGTGTDSPAAQFLIDNQNIRNHRLLGKKSDVESFVNAMDICVLSTFTEGISNSILEYMALEKPVIATRGGGTNEIVINNKTGFLINPSNPDELAEKLGILLDDADLRASMGHAGKERVLNEFSIDKMARKYMDLYKMILSGKFSSLL
jgi:glycosyltransferase involved in cell wall biosynthesis